VYDLVTDAPSYALAWDQSLAPSVGTALVANVQKLFRLQLSPEQFVAAMSAAR
jgi:hypothetical protein